jgi:outer membrane protein assembly factor BamD
MRRISLPLAAVVLACAFSACRSGVSEDPILKLSAAESLTQGKEQMAKEKYARARPYFTHAFEVEPNSVVGREGLLLAADTYYLEGGSTNYVQAEAKYRDFLNRFPTSTQAGYVQFQIANSLAKRMEKPDRDQTVTRKALEAYQELIRLYPTSEYAAQAQEKIKLVQDSLAEHEFIIGRFYLRFGTAFSAVERFKYLLDTFPDYPQKEKVLYHLILSYQKLGRTDDARKTLDRLRTEYPQSPWLAQVPEMKPAPAAKKPSAAKETPAAKKPPDGKETGKGK